MCSLWAKRDTARRNAVPILSMIAGDGIGIAQMLPQERRHLTTHLQVRHIPVEVDPVQALHIQTHVPIEKIRAPSPTRPSPQTARKATRSTSPRLGGPRRSLAGYFALKKSAR